MPLRNTATILDMFSNNYGKWGLIGLGFVFLAILVAVTIYFIDRKSQIELYKDEH